MPTDKERREVAARLRELDGWETETLSDTWYVEQLSKIVGYSDAGSMTERLADLIEPEERTCRVVTEVRALSLTQDMHTKSCSACGYVFGSEVHTQLLPGLGERVAVDPVVIPNYCPNCGAKVIHDA